MEELSIEEKAKRYDDAIDVCRKLYNKAKADGYTSDIEDYEQMFPELAESEGEKIRKYILKCCEETIEANDGGLELSMDTTKKLKNWLEKQGEHANFLDKIQIGDKVTRNEDGVLVNLSQLSRVANKDEKLREQKPAGFNIGDEITVNGRACRVVAVDRSAWSIEDDLTLSDTIKSLQLCGMCSTDRYFWLQSLKNRIKFQPKQEWSEEDESTRKALSNLIGMYFLGCTDISGRDRLLNWLNSLKERVQLQSQKQWKPTAEQMKFLWKYSEQNNYDGTILRSLYNDLKKLRDEK